MALKREFATADDVPAELKSLYVEKDGRFVLDLEAGDDGKLHGALKKEREAREAADKALREIRKQLGDMDPVKAREALKTLAELEERADLGEIPEALQSKIDTIVRKRTDRMATDYQGKLSAAEERAKGLTARLEELLIDNRLRTAAAKGGVKPSALDDVVLFGRQQWKLDKDGNPVPMKGDEIMFGKEPNKPMTAEEWITERSTDRPHWFETSSGGGAKGSGTAPAQGGQHVISAEKAKDFAAYKAAKAAAEKAGQTLVIAQ